jgi:primosomal protein N' (replication factor Y) (superfamily II helicase)
VPLAEPFDYLWQGTVAPPPGCRVRVPFGRGERIGIVVEHPEASSVPRERLRPVLAALDHEPVLDAELLRSLRWAADYYHHPIGEVLTHALPARLRQGRHADPAPSDGAGPADSIEPARTQAPQLTAAQQRVLAGIESDAGTGYRAFVLHGVTGSGKTEVYMQLMAGELARGRQTLLLVPEIGLTPQLVDRLAERFGSRLAVMHSALSEKERFEAWRRVRSAEAGLVLGTRSAVFAPLANPGLIIVDEEHDSSYKQQQGFRYSARDLAVLRASRLGIPVLLASATPSLESWHHARSGRYRLLTMPDRVGRARKPDLRMIDMNRHASRRGLSTPMVAAIERHLADSRQVLLFLNRRGFAPVLFCPQCRDSVDCSHCDAHMTVHARIGRLRCHHCGAESALSWSCARCGGERIAVGSGTQRIADELKSLFPEARVTRIDRDATARKGALAQALREVADGSTGILVGTQMLTKGHDFPRVTLVGVLNADQGLFGTDFRSDERLAQTILQVAGRAGRGEWPGEVLIQTHHPGHALLERLLAQDYAAFADWALAERRAASWPPFAHLALWRAEASRRDAAFSFLERVRGAASRPADPVRILGPAPDRIERKGGRYRAQLLLQSTERAALHALLERTLAVVRTWPAARRVKWAIDVDPIEL